MRRSTGLNYQPAGFLTNTNFINISLPFRSMQIIETNFWKLPEAIFLVLKECLDPTPIVKNSPVCVLYDKGKLVSFGSVKKWKTCIELGTLVTKKQYRGKGYASKLVRHSLKKHKTAYLVCRPELERFYKRFGFRKVATAPYPIPQRIGFVNFFIRLFGREPIIIMKR